MGSGGVWREADAHAARPCMNIKVHAFGGLSAPPGRLQKIGGKIGKTFAPIGNDYVRSVRKSR